MRSLLIIFLLGGTSYHFCDVRAAHWAPRLFFPFVFFICLLALMLWLFARSRRGGNGNGDGHGADGGSGFSLGDGGD